MKWEKELEERAKVLDTLAWDIGTYVLDGLAAIFGGRGYPYPSMPRSANSIEAPQAQKKGEVMTDGARFAAFASVHNKQRRERNKS